MRRWLERMLMYFRYTSGISPWQASQMGEWIDMSETPGHGFVEGMEDGEVEIVATTEGVSLQILGIKPERRLIARLVVAPEMAREIAQRLTLASITVEEHQSDM